MRLLKNSMLLLAMMGWAMLSAGCGNSDVVKVTAVPTNGSSVNSFSPQDIKPDIHTNLPPPETSTVTENTAENFFRNKELVEKFSPELQENIRQRYEREPIQRPEEEPREFHTLLGPTQPVHSAAIQSAEGYGCDPKTDYICLDSPEDGFETTQPGVDVIGNIDLSKLAFFGENDPVAVVSIFNNSTGGAANEVPVMPADVKQAQDARGTLVADIGRFSTAIALGGGGNFTIVVSSYRVTPEGGNELVAIARNISRTEAPRAEYVEARPSPKNYLAASGHEQDVVNNDAVIAAEALEIKIKLLTAASTGVKTKFESFNEADQLKSAVVVTPQDSGEIIGKVYLHQGINKIKMSIYAPAIPSAPVQVLPELKVFNSWGGPKIKIEEPSNSLVVQANADQKVELKFCYTFLPHNVRGDSPAPVINDDCVPGRLTTPPEVFVNGRQIGTDTDPKHDTLECNDQGSCVAKITPDFGLNLYKVIAKDVVPVADQETTSTVSGAFVFGVPMPLIKDGVINELKNFADAANFTKRGVNLDIGADLLKGDVKTMLNKYLNRPETKRMLLDNFASADNKAGYSCPEYRDPNTGDPVSSNGDSSITFLKETFDLDKLNISVDNIETMGDGMLHIKATINGLRGDADLRAARGGDESPVSDGTDWHFLPLTFSIAKVEVNLGIAFSKRNDLDLNKDHVFESRSILDIRQIAGEPFLKITGDGPLGRPVYVNSNRNPWTAGVELLDWQQAVVLSQFNNIMGGTLLCGVDEGLNNEEGGVLGKAIADLGKNLTGYNIPNIFRYLLRRDVLGKPLDLDIAYDVMRGDITIDWHGIHIRNIPMRFNPGPEKLQKMVEDFKNHVAGALSLEGILGAVSRWPSANESADSQPNITTDTHNLGIQLSEDTINQALFAANLAGVLDLDVDANFYTKNKITPNERLAPTGMALASGMDVNRDGIKDDKDKETPVLLEIRPNKQIPPMLTFLTKEEVQAFAKEEADKAAAISGATSPQTNNGADTATASQATKAFFTEDGHYFKLALADLEISAYPQEVVPDSSEGMSYFCKVRWEDDPSIGTGGFCSLSAETYIDSKVYPALCREKEIFAIPRLNGAKQQTPLYRIKAGLILHGKFLGVDREVSAKEKLTDPAAKEKTILHIQIAPADRSATALLTSVEVTENNTGEPEIKVGSGFRTILTGAFDTACANLNELRIPIPEKITGKKVDETSEPQDLLPDFGVKYLDLGETGEHQPRVFIDDNNLFLDVLAFAGLKLVDSTQGGQ